MDSDLLPVQKVADLSGRSRDSIHRDADGGILPVIRIGRERAFELPPAALYALQHRFGVKLAGFERDDTEKLITAIEKADGAAISRGYAALIAYAGIAGDDARTAIATIVMKHLRPVAPYRSVEKLVGAGTVRK